MKAGTLRHRITIQSLVPAQDEATGIVTDTWTDFVTNYPADVHPLSGREFIAAGAEQSEVVARIVIRHLAGVKKSMRVLHGAKIYDIKAALEDPRSGLEYLTLHVSEVTTDG